MGLVIGADPEGGPHELKEAPLGGQGQEEVPASDPGQWGVPSSGLCW